MRIFQTGFSARLSFLKLFPVLVCRRRLKRVRGALWQHFVANGGKPLLLVTHSPVEVLGGQTGTLYPPAVLDRILFATRYTRHLDRHGYIRFQNWKLYGERGLAQAPVTVWVYDGFLKIEHQAVTLAQYGVELQ